METSCLRIDVARKFDPANSALLEDPERAAWQDPQMLLRTADVGPGYVVLDVGAGTGYLSLPAGARVAPTGRVFAIDVQSEMIQKLRRRLREQRLANVFPVLSNEEHIALSDNIADAAFMVNVLHEVEGGHTLAEVYRILRSGGTLLVVDWKKESMEKGPPKEERLSDAEATTLVERTGFDLTRSPAVGPYHYGLLFTKPGAPRRPVG